MTYLGKEGIQTWIGELIDYYQAQKGSALCRGGVADANRAHGAWIVLQDIRFEIDSGAHDVNCVKEVEL